MTNLDFKGGYLGNTCEIDNSFFSIYSIASRKGSSIETNNRKFQTITINPSFFIQISTGAK